MIQTNLHKKRTSCPFYGNEAARLPYIQLVLLSQRKTEAFVAVLATLNPASASAIKSARTVTLRDKIWLFCARTPVWPVQLAPDIQIKKKNQQKCDLHDKVGRRVVGWGRLSKSKFFCAIKMLWLNILQRNMHFKWHKTMCNYFLFVKLWQILEISLIFSCFAFISPKFAQIIKYFAQSCDCMIAAFRNSGVGMVWHSCILCRHVW